MFIPSKKPASFQASDSENQLSEKWKQEMVVVEIYIWLSSQ